MRKKCFIKNCKRLSRNKGLSKTGKTIYGKYCVFHHKSNQKNKENSVFGFYEKDKISNKQCEVCGWNKSFCDRHRIDPKLGYTKENVKILCPNCHRLESYQHPVDNSGGG